MSKMNNSILYSFRLNISNPRQLALHKILRDLDTKIYKSKSNYIIDILSRVLLDGEESFEESIERQGGYVTKEYVDGIEEKIRKDLDEELNQKLFNMVISATAGVRAISVPENEKTKQSKDNNESEEEQKLLSDLNSRWT